MWEILGEHFNQVCRVYAREDGATVSLGMLGLLSQEHPCRLLRPRCSAATCHALPGEGGAAPLQIPEGLLAAVRVHDDSQFEP